MYRAVRPRIAVPVHGEARHLLAQAQLAQECGVRETIVTRNGEVVKLAPGPAAVIGEVPVGRLAADGKALLDPGGETLKSRQRMTFNGAALATLVLDAAGRLLSPPRVTVQGVASEDDAADELSRKVAEAVDDLSPRERRDDAAVEEAARIAVRRVLRARYDKRPVTEVHVVRLGGRNAWQEARMIGRLNHVAIAVPDAAAAAATYRALLGAAVSEPMPLPAHGVTTIFVTLPNTKIELIEPLGDASPIRAFLERHKGGGMHHLCYEVADIAAARDRLVAGGARILGDGVPRPGAHGKPVLFLHPGDFSGTLIELEEAP